MSTRPEIRATAREKLGGQIFATNWLMALLCILISSAILSAASSFVAGYLVLIGPITFGVALVFISFARGKDSVDIRDLFKGFTDGGFVRLLILGLMYELFSFLWGLLFVIPGIVIPGIVKRHYSYTLSFVLAIDHPDWEWKQCIDESRRLMNGYKWKLFLLDLSFIGWYIVGMLACGVGVWWVFPYHEMARAEFYQVGTSPR